MAQRPLVFVVGTGRTGSTLLSRILRRHSAILSLNELFSSIRDAFPERPLSGADFWEILATPNAMMNRMIANGIVFPELLYLRIVGGRFAADTTGIPALSLMVLPHLTDDPDELFDALAVEIRAWPERPVALHYQALFDTLAARFGRQVVVERSGYSLERIQHLRQAFPQARFVHMYRDGPDCALSMSRHPGFRFAALSREILEITGADSIAELTAEQRRRLPPDLAAFAAAPNPDVLRDRVIPLSRFGSMWSDSILRGAGQLARIPAGERMSLRYEDLLAAPVAELTRVAEFLGVRPDPEWLRIGGEMLVDRSGAARSLAPADLTALRESCEPGTSVLRRLER